MIEEDGFLEEGLGFSEENEQTQLVYREYLVFKKAMEIFYVTRGIVDTIKEKEDKFDVRNFMLRNAGVLGSKIAAAEGGTLFHIRMECAYQIKIAAKELLINVRLCQMDNLTDKRYLELLKRLLDEFRLYFVEWTKTFDSEKDIDDGWKIGI
ncbi:MAG TPA: hypothetical protein VK766_03635 [Cytophagaceae bacterium]|nr:hypothetical protein [Cytophagaceae bacterium]